MLDIIIPTYKNKEGLVKTLRSIPNYKEITITVVDDDSNIDYSDLYTQFNFNMQLLFPNSGPGVARQIGMMITHEPYIMFIDTGDYCVEGAFDEVLGVININPDVSIFSWQFNNPEAPYTVENNNLHGRVYKREFLEKYHVSFSEKGSYANEDVGFNHICRLALLQNHTDKPAVMHLKHSILEYDINDKNSITRRDNSAFIYRDQNYGLAYNAIHAYNISKLNGVNEGLLKDYASDIMGSQYFFFIRTLEERSEYAEEAWGGARYYYINLFKNIFDANDDITISYRRIINFYKRVENHPPKIHFNIKLFLRLLEENEHLPEYYKTIAQNLDTLEEKYD